MTLRRKLFLTIALIILGLMAATYWLGGQALQSRLLKEAEIGLLSRGSIIANMARPFLVTATSSELDRIAQNHGPQIGARILILDSQGRVLADTFAEPELEGATLEHREVQVAQTGTATTGVRFLPEDGWVMYATVPILSQKQVQGIVFLSEDINDTLGAVSAFRRQLLGIAALAGLIAAGLSLFMAQGIVRPLQLLTAKINDLKQGLLDERVPVRGNDEVAQLGRAFNDMSAEIQRQDQSRRQFIADASHEIRTPLATIQVLAEALGADEEMPRSKQSQFLQGIVSETDRLGHLVADLMALAEADDAALMAAPENLDLAALAHEEVERFQPLAANLEIDLTLDPSNQGQGQRAPAYVDPVLIRRALGNLVQNALTYTERGGRVVVRVSGGEELDQRPAVSVSVIDTGIGIREEDIPHLFERFFRIDRSRSRASGGTGLGLAIVKEIVDLHHGKVSVASEPGKGTTFTLSLPSFPQV